MIEYGRYNVTVPAAGDAEPERYVWEPDEVTLGEQRLIIDEFASSGGTRSYRAWIRAVGTDEDPDAVQVLVWFLRRVAGRQMERLAVDLPKIRHITIELIDDDPAGDDDAGDGDDLDPEGSAGSGPAT